MSETMWLIITVAIVVAIVVIFKTTAIGEFFGTIFYAIRGTFKAIIMIVITLLIAFLLYKCGSIAF